MVLKEINSLIYAHVENVGDVLAVISDFQSLTVISLTLTYVASNVDIGKEMHLDLVNAVACARLTASALGVKRESSCLIASLLCVRRLRIEPTYQIEKSDISRRITPRSPSYRALVDADDLIEVGITRDAFTLYLLLSGSVELMLKIRNQSRIDKR